MPAPSTIVFFLLAAALLFAIPGRVTTYILTRSLTQGRRAGLASTLGIQLADLTHVTAAAVGLSGLLMTSVFAFSVVKYVGAAYLIVLGLRTLLTEKDHDGAHLVLLASVGCSSKASS